MRKFLLSTFIVIFFSCTPALFAQEINSDNYGISKHDPILVGGEDMREGPVNQLAYLAKLTGPGGEKVFYRRKGSCCEFETPNGILGGGLLDMYEITYVGMEKACDPVF